MADEQPVEKPIENVAPPVAPPAAPKPPEKPAGIAGAVGFILLVVVGVAVGSVVTRKNGPAPVQTAAGLADARAKAEKGDRTGAALAYSKVIAEDPETGDAREAREELSKLAERSVAASVPLADAALVLETAQDCSAVVRSDTIAEGCLRATAEALKDTKGALAITKVLMELAMGNEVYAARAAALDAAIATDPKDVASTTARAEIDLFLGDFKQAAERLAAHEADVGDGEGARVLGLALMKTDAEDRAFVLLKRYYDAHVDAFRRALDGLKEADKKARAAAVEDFKARRFSPAFERRLDEADKATQKKLVDDWVRERVFRDRNVKQALRARIPARNLAEVAIGLGGLEVRLAALRPAERRTHLENAERYYISVIDIAAGDAQLLFLARVRFDLGREKDAQEILEELFRRHGRTGDFLLGLAVTFQQVAAARDVARELAEEAYGKLLEPQLKEKAAAIRAAVTMDPAAAVTWYERAGSSPPVKAMLAHRRAQLAADEGRFEDARKSLDEVLDFLARENAPPEQVGALRLQRFTLTGERSDLDATVETLEKATAGPDARPDRLDLLADVLLTRAIFDVVKTRVPTDVIRERSLELFHFAAKDETDLQALIGELAAHPDRLRAVEVRERAVAVDATREESWEGLLADASARRDVAGVDALAQRIAKTPLDRMESRRRLQDYWTGKQDTTFRESIDRKRKHSDAILASARAKNEPTTVARALVARASIEEGAPGVGASGDLDVAVKLADEAEKLAPRPFTRSALQQALLARALDHARKGSKALDDLEHDHGKLGAPAVLALASRGDAALAATLAKDEDVKRAAALVPADGEPQTLHLYAVTLAKAETRDAVAQRLAASKLALARARASCALQPESPECVLELATILDARGEKDDSKKILEGAKKAGVALPYDVMK